MTLSFDAAHEFLRRTLERLTLEEHIGFSLVDDDEMTRMNSLYRNLDKPTDVLSFAMQEGENMPGAETYLGDLVVSFDTALRQAQEHGHSLEDELALLLVHGTLHLMGFDHELGQAEAILMAEHEMTLLSSMGISPLCALIGRSF